MRADANDIYEDAQNQIETLIGKFPISFAAAREISPGACAALLNSLGNSCFFLASVFFHGAQSPLFGLAWAATFAGESEDLSAILPQEDEDSEKTKQLMVAICRNRLDSIQAILSEYPPVYSPEEVFATWRSGRMPVGLLVGTHFTAPELTQVQVEVGVPISAQLRELETDFPRLRTMDFIERGISYADTGILCYWAAAGYYVWANALPSFVRVLASLDVIAAASAISEALLPLLAEHYAALEQRCAIGNAYPFVFATAEGA